MRSQLGEQDADSGLCPCLYLMMIFGESRDDRVKKHNHFQRQVPAFKLLQLKGSFQAVADVLGARLPKYGSFGF